MTPQPPALWDLPVGPVASASAGGFDTVVGVADQGWWDDDHDGWGWGGWLIMMGFMAIF